MARVLFIFVLLALAAVAAVWIVERPDDVVLIWGGLRIETSLAVVVAGVLLVAAALALLWSLLRFIGRIPRVMRGGARARRREKGQAALSRGLLAVGAGDAAAAQRHAREARKHVGGDPLSLLLDAQAAQLAGDRAAAHLAFRTMTTVEPARLLGWRGLFVEAQRAGDADAARAAAEAATRIAPAAAWANEALLADCCSRGDWEGARRAVEQGERLRLIDKTTSKRQRAVLLAAEAEAAADIDATRALTLAREACELAPDLVPAVALAARLLAERGDIRRASRLIEAAWKVSPHPDLADAFIHLRSGDSALDRLQRAQTLAKIAPADIESACALARAALDARELGVARAALTPHLDGRPMVRVCLLMADLSELADSDSGEARHWLARAARAPRDKAWVADGVVSDRWLPASPVTGRLDAFVWTAPPERLAPDEPPPATPQSAAQPPLIEAAAEPAVVAPEPSPRPPAAANEASPAVSSARPTPVIFPVAHAPDDPGPKQDAAAARWRAVDG